MALPDLTEDEVAVLLCVQMAGDVGVCPAFPHLEQRAVAEDLAADGILYRIRKPDGGGYAVRAEFEAEVREMYDTTALTRDQLRGLYREPPKPLFNPVLYKSLGVNRRASQKWEIRVRHEPYADVVTVRATVTYHERGDGVSTITYRDIVLAGRLGVAELFLAHIRRELPTLGVVADWIDDDRGRVVREGPHFAPQFRLADDLVGHFLVLLRSYKDRRPPAPGPKTKRS